ncbi:MAG: hypothetical protein R3266_11940 [Gemmatimonadota bacterium]|nr:hypothetical protein [Gemmatimonadota bacterium]
MAYRLAPVAALAALALVWSPDAASAQEGLLEELSAVEKSLWEGWKNHDPAPFLSEAQ